MTRNILGGIALTAATAGIFAGAAVAGTPITLVQGGLSTGWGAGAAAAAEAAAAEVAGASAASVLGGAVSFIITVPALGALRSITKATELIKKKYFSNMWTNYEEKWTEVISIYIRKKYRDFFSSSWYIHKIHYLSGLLSLVNKDNPLA